MAEDHLYITTVLMKQMFAELGIEDNNAKSGLKKNRGHKTGRSENKIRNYEKGEKND